VQILPARNFDCSAVTSPEAWTDRLAHPIFDYARALIRSRMLRFFARLVGLLLLAGGFSALVVDGTRSLAGGRLIVTTLREGALSLFPERFQALQTSIEQNMAPLWDALVAMLLHLPISMSFGGIGALLILLSQKQRAPIGYARR
jgi:hypothetical protein